MKPSTRTIAALVAVALIVVIAAVAGIVTVAVHRAHRPDPQLTAYAHGTAVTVPPYRYCTVEDQGQRLALKCAQSGITKPLPTPAGYPVQLSLPKQIADAPWVMVQQYALPDGTTVQHLASYRDYPAGTMAVTVDSRPQHDLRLVGVEIQLVLPVRDETGAESFAPYQVWSIATA
ncbi:DUF2771 domain-containing protein [Nocardia sp. alder85J]|uniref:DUF2771 domain-containing protein n=1 Tax=Nocardia sp. alder85J TaxID=2862949 RepID=UPI001CD56E64|nr:DUF2771 domain-containing protein [Nocardia sp. alder85J]MCX4093318.1 DUF2771 domain-containing protein [Nocardia sp. alder85J]